MSKARVSALILAGLSVTAPALAQPRGVPGHPMMGGGGGVDCVISAISMSAEARRTAAVIDVSVRVRAHKGGSCMLRPDAIQVTTLRAGAVSRFLGWQAIDADVQKPWAIADAVGGDRVRPYMAPLKAGEEHTVLFRHVVEGDVLAGGEVDPPGRMRVDVRALGARIHDGAVLTAGVSLSSKGAGSASLLTGNPKLGAKPIALTGGKGEVWTTLTKDDLLPVLEWKQSGALPEAATAAALVGGGLAAAEYLRDGWLRELAQGLAESKDEKKTAAAWDSAFDAAYSAARSGDPVVAALGVRAMGYLGGGLAPAVTGVRADGDAGELPVVPKSVAELAAKVTTSLSDASGQKLGPSPVGARSVRTVMAVMGEPASKKKDAGDALKRFAARVEKGETRGEPAGVLLATMPIPKLSKFAPPTARVIAFGPKGPTIVGEKAGASAPRRPFGARITHALTSHLGAAKLFGGLSILVLLGFALWWLASRLQSDSPQASAR